MRLRRILVHSLALAVLLGVAALYVQPEFMVSLAGLLWGCF